MTLVKAKMNGAAIVSRGILFALIWWILTAGVASSWWIGVPAVLLAIAASIALIPPVPLIWYGFLRFAPFFLTRSLLGGADVAWRAVHPGMPIAPVLIAYPLRLPPGLPQVFMTNTVSLLPGTLSAALEQSVLKIHVLDSRGDFMAELVVVEQHVARLFGISLKVSGGGE